ncbi:MAG: response regulator transcription factor [Chloroflexi bacterium]|nr:response regulator transcription factor [Chloroflexota bacterium]
MRRRTILVVEDDRELLGLLEAILEAAGFRVVTASEWASAWEAFWAVRPAAVLLDWMLPGVDGGELCRRLRAAGGDRTPILMMSCDDRLAQRAHAFGADDYILKPFDVTDLLDRVGELLDRPARGQDAVATALSLSWTP